MRTFALQPHTSTPTPFIREVRVQIESLSHSRIRLVYEVFGDLEQLEIPVTNRSQRTDGLWRNTCFEAFVRGTRGQGYEEWNFSPSSEWAAYRFDDYRAGMAPLDVPAEPQISCAADAHRLELTALIARTDTSGPLHLGLSTVLRDRSGKIYYWALRHAPDKPDFHHASSFAALLDGASDA
jgi:hypothetical protein